MAASHLHALKSSHPFPLQLQALYDGQYVDAHFTRSFYKHMLGQVGAVFFITQNGCCACPQAS